MRRATPVPANPQAINVSKFQGVLTQSRKMADVDFKIYLDTIVERIELDLNKFIQLGEIPSRHYWIEETSLSKLEGKRIFEKSILAKSVPFCIIGKGEDDYYLLWYGALESTK